MHTQTTIDQLSHHVGQTVSLSGWLYNSRSSGKLLFLIVRDGTGLCQCVVEKSSAAAVFEAAEKLHQEASIVVEGAVRADERSIGGHELAVSGLQIIQNTEGFPISPKPHGIDFLMNRRHLWFRSRRVVRACAKAGRHSSHNSSSRGSRPNVFSSRRCRR